MLKPIARVLYLSTVLAMFAATPLGAQPASLTDPVLKRIWTLGMDSSALPRLAHAMLDSVGPRLTGSGGMKAASEWIIRTYKSWGIDARQERYGTWRGWRRGVSHIDLVEPRVRTLEGQMLGWSPGTRGAPVTAPAIILPKFADSSEFVKWLPQAKGKFVLISPGLPTCRPSEDWARWATVESRARMDTVFNATLREWAVDPDSSKAYRGTGYGVALGTGTLGNRLEQAGVAGVITSRTKLTFPNPSAGGGRGGWDPLESTCRHASLSIL